MRAQLMPHQVAVQAFDKHKKYKDISTFIKKEYEKRCASEMRQILVEMWKCKDSSSSNSYLYAYRYPPSGKATEGVFHVVVGSNFGGTTSQPAYLCIGKKTNRS